MRLPIFSLSLMLGLLASGPAIATPWESLFQARSGNTEARVELERQSFQKRVLPGETVISAHLWLFYQDDGATVQARGNYEVSCVARQVFRSNWQMQTADRDRNESTIRVPNKTLLVGKEYQDFVGIMTILCAK